MPGVIDAFAQGTHAARPAAAPANTGYYYLETDTDGGTLFQSTGSAWVQLAPGVSASAGMTFLSLAGDHTLSAGNVNVLLTATGHTLTLPVVAAAAGQAVAVAVADWTTMVVTVAPASGEHFYGGGTALTVYNGLYWCDGTQWYVTQF